VPAPSGGLAVQRPKTDIVESVDGIAVAMLVRGQYFFRWLNNFRADGPIPVAETFDHGFEFVLSQFIVPKRVEAYGRTSFVFGQFRNSYEYAPGLKW
jgi:hypothetical protein